MLKQKKFLMLSVMIIALLLSGCFNKASTKKTTSQEELIKEDAQEDVVVKKESRKTPIFCAIEYNFDQDVAVDGCADDGVSDGLVGADVTWGKTDDGDSYAIFNGQEGSGIEIDNFSMIQQPNKQNMVIEVSFQTINTPSLNNMFAIGGYGFGGLVYGVQDGKGYLEVFEKDSNTGRRINGQLPIDDGWHTLKISLLNTGLKIYVDGKEDVSDIVPSVYYDSKAKIYIGRRQISGESFFGNVSYFKLSME